MNVELRSADSVIYQPYIIYEILEAKALISLAKASMAAVCNVATNTLLIANLLSMSTREKRNTYLIDNSLQAIFLHL